MENTKELIERLRGEINHLKDHVEVTMSHNLIINLKVDRIKEDFTKLATSLKQEAL